MYKLTIVLLAFVCIFGNALSLTGTGPPKCAAGAQCPTKTGTYWKGVIPCAPDCKAQHGGGTGTCRANYCCYCGTPSGTRNEKSLQCRDGGDANSKTGYQEVCDIDCKCNHGAVGGTCNFKTQACICGKEATENQCKYTAAQILAIVKKYKLPLNIAG